MAVAHLALDLGAGHQGGDRVDDDEVERAGADQHVRDLERLLTGVGLGEQQRVGVHAELLGVVGVERVLRVDERHDAAGRLGVGHRVQGDRRLAGGLRAVDLHDAAARQAADAEGDVERDRAGRDDLDGASGLSPRRMTAPLPNCLSIWASAMSRAFSRSSVAMMATFGCRCSGSSPTLGRGSTVSADRVRLWTRTGPVDATVCRTRVRFQRHAGSAPESRPEPPASQLSAGGAPRRPRPGRRARRASGSRRTRSGRAGAGRARRRPR